MTSDAGARLFIVEDEYFVALVMEDAVTSNGHQVAGVFATGEDAVAAAAALRPDLVLMDVRLAGAMSGIDAAIALKEMGIRCIFATANADAATRAAGSRAEPLGWLVKPFALPELVGSVQAALQAIRPDARP